MSKRLQTYDAPGITVTYDPEICIHAAECVRSLPAVFDPQQKRWIRPELASPEEVERAVARCPTGALQSSRPASASTPAAPRGTTRPMAVVRLLRNGPLLVSGPVRVETEGGEVILEAERVALCRCGGTGNPPFCDGSHARRNFRSAR
jgi:uncharacterized Fe-S cluster protein YjdI